MISKSWVVIGRGRNNSDTARRTKESTYADPSPEVVGSKSKKSQYGMD